MPPDNNKPTRKALRTSTEEEIERWRSRGEISCAECKRLKLKCDKGLPCGACVRRGCAAICPNGSLSTGHGTRFVLADTEELHEQIAIMSQRIRLLEDALAQSHSLTSSEQHPLLNDELKNIKFGADAARPISQPRTPRKAQAPDMVAETITALGTLAIGDNGASKYFGRAAGTEALLMIGSDSEGDDSAGDFDDPDGLTRLAHTFTAAIFFVDGLGLDEEYENLLELIYGELPSRTRAKELIEAYGLHIAWMFTPITLDELTDVYEHIYLAHEEREMNPNATAWKDTSPHKIAVLFLVFAMGALMDTNQPPFNAEARTYYGFSRALISLRSIFDSPTIETVQAVALTAFYNLHDGRRNSFESAWNILALASKLAQSCGLHRDCGTCDLDPVIVQRRRSLFWELHSLDVYFSVALGRPVSLNLSHSDCEFPEDKLPGQITLELYKAVKTVFTLVLDFTLAIKIPPYDKVLKLDRLVREKIPEPPDNPLNTPLTEMGPLPFGIMKYMALAANRSSALIYLHRGFFAQAIMDHPENPMLSKYAPSFLAAYKEASWTIKMCVFRVNTSPQLCARWWSIWTHIFTAALIVGTIVTRAPAAEMASTAFIELGLVIDAFEKAARDSRSRGSLAILTKLRDTAIVVYGEYVQHGVLPSQHARFEHQRDELSLLGGQTQVANSKRLNDSGSRRATSSPERSVSPRETYTSLPVGANGMNGTNGINGSHSSPGSQTSYRDLFAASGYHYDYDMVPSQDGMSGHAVSQPSADYSWSPLGALDGLYIPGNTWAAQAPVIHQPQIMVPDIPPAVNAENAMDMGMFEAAGTADQAWDHSWMAFLRDSGLG